MARFASGVKEFQKNAFPSRQQMFERLAEGQSPEALFITCSDSRVDPNLITQTEPGELFICRNAGNIVPPHTNHTGAMTASIEFAVGALNVPHIVVCGHTGCGAMKGALDPESLKEFPHVHEWISYAKAALLTLREQHPDATEAEKLDLMIQENVILQMVHLRTHPYVASRLSAGRTEIHGWVYDIRSGGVIAYCDDSKKFVPFAEKYGEQAADAVIHSRSSAPAAE